MKDLTDGAAFEDIFKKHPDIKYVLHTASPISSAQSDFVANFVTPAVEGTLSVLKAAQKYGKNVKRVVTTSLFAAAYPLLLGPKRPEITLTEESWNHITIKEAEESSFAAYAASKKSAERALWDFKETEKPDFAVATILAPLIHGLPIHQTTYSTLPSSLAYFKSFLESPLDMVLGTPAGSGHVDVRDVARINIKALFNEKFDNGRWIAAEGITDNQTPIDIIHKYRPEQSTNIFVGTPNTFEAKEYFKIDDSKTRAILNFEYISLEKSILDEFDALTLSKKQEEGSMANAWTKKVSSL